MCFLFFAAAPSFAETELGDGWKLGGYALMTGNFNLDTVKSTAAGPNPNLFTGNLGDANQFMFNSLQLNFSKMNEGGEGLVFEMMFGRDVDTYVNFLGAPDCADFACNNIQEAYITWKQGATTWTVGKFVTLMGVEVVENTANPNLTLGHGFSFAEPVAHVGAKVSLPLGKATATLAAVNGWDITQDNNTGKTIVGQVIWPLGGTASLILLGNMGPEQAGINRNNRTSWQAVLSNLSLSEGLSAYLQFDMGEEEGLGVPATVPPSDAEWTCWGVWLKKQMNEDTTAALRYEMFDDEDGVRTGLIQKINSLTLTMDKKLSEKVTGRLEYRHDDSSDLLPGVLGPFDGATEDSQDIVGAGLVYSF